MKKGDNNTGAAMIAVLCIMAVFLTLCLGLLLTSSVLLKRSYKTKYQEQCRVSAVTVSKELEYNLCYEENSEFFQFIQNNINIATSASAWPYYNTSELGHGEKSNVYKTLSVDGEDTGSAGKISARLYWEWEYNGDPKDIILHIDVTASLGGENHTIYSTYNLNINSDESGNSQWMWNFSERK